MIVSKIEILKRIDSILGTMAVLLLNVPCQKPKGTSSFLLIRPGGIGDAVLLAPAIRVLRQAYPESTIDLLAEKRNAGIFSLVPEVDKVLHYDVPRELMAVFRCQYDVVIDTEQWHRLSAVVARVTKAPTIIGFETNERRRLFSHPVSYSHDQYEAESFLDLLSPLGIGADADCFPPYLKVPQAADDAALSLLGNLAGDRFVALFPGATKPERRWSVAKFRSLTEGLMGKGIHVVVIGGSVDRKICAEIVAGENGLDLAGKTTLLESAAVIARAALLISGDSGILHIGVGLDKPTVSLFGPGRAGKWAPRGDKHIVINKCLPCSPCTSFGYTPKCPISAKCMADISVDDVMAAVDKLMIYNGLGRHGRP